MSQNLNDRAQERFQELRKKMKLDVIDKEIEKGNIPCTVDTEKLKKVFAGTIEEDRIETTTEINKAAIEIDKTFDFINSLNLPSQLSLAIGLIIAAHQTEDKSNIALAVTKLGEYANN